MQARDGEEEREEGSLASVERAFETARSLHDARTFTERYLAPRHTGVQWLQWYDVLSDHINQNSHSMTLVHPGSGKTTRVGFIEALFQVARDRTIRFGYFSKTQAKASLFMQAVGRELRTNEDLIRDFGAFHDPYDENLIWNQTSIRVVGSDHAKPTPTFINLGATSQVESLRLSHLVLDDAIDLITARSAAESSKMDMLFGTLIDRLDPGGRLVIVGHRFLPNDFYQRVISTRENVEVLILPAYHKPGDPFTPDEEGVPLVPEIWPHPSLLDEKRENHKGWEWSAWYMQEQVSPENSTFAEVPRHLVRSMPETARIVAVFDPAYSTNESADWSVGVAGCPYEGGVLVTDIADWKIAQGWASRFSEFARQTGASSAHVEVNNAQTLGEEMRAYVQDVGLHLRVHDLRSKGRKTFRIGELADAASHGRVFFLEALQKTRAFQRLVSEWDLYPNSDHDDHLDAVDMLRRVTSRRSGRAGLRTVNL